MTLGSPLIGPKEANDSAWLGGVRRKKLPEPHMVDAWWVLGLEAYLKRVVRAQKSGFIMVPFGVP